MEQQARIMNDAGCAIGPAQRRPSLQPVKATQVLISTSPR